VYIDENQAEYSLTSTDGSWVILLTYPHSNHKIVISLKEATTSNLLEVIFSQSLTILFIVIVAATITIAFLIIKRKSKNK